MHIRFSLAIAAALMLVAASSAYAIAEPGAGCNDKKAKATGTKASDLTKPFGRNINNLSLAVVAPNQ